MKIRTIFSYLVLLSGLAVSAALPGNNSVPGIPTGTATVLNPDEPVLKQPSQTAMPEPQAGPLAEIFLVVDATGEGDNAVRKQIFQMYLQNPSMPVKIFRATPEEAVKMVENGKAKLALVEFRGEKPDFQLPHQPYAAGALVFYVHADNFTRALNKAQATALLTSEKPDWLEFNKQREDIHRIRIRANSPGGLLPERMILEKGQTAAKSFFKVGKIGELLLLVQSNPLALGVGVFSPECPATVQALAYEGVIPDETNIRNGKYPLAFRRTAVYHEREAESPLLKKLLEQLQSAEFSDFLAEDALIPAQSFAPLPPSGQKQ